MAAGEGRAADAGTLLRRRRCRGRVAGSAATRPTAQRGQGKGLQQVGDRHQNLRCQQCARLLHIQPVPLQNTACEEFFPQSVYGGMHAVTKYAPERLEEQTRRAAARRQRRQRLCRPHHSHVPPCTRQAAPSHLQPRNRHTAGGGRGRPTQGTPPAPPASGRTARRPRARKPRRSRWGRRPLEPSPRRGQRPTGRGGRRTRAPSRRPRARARRGQPPAGYPAPCLSGCLRAAANAGRAPSVRRQTSRAARLPAGQRRG